MWKLMESQPSLFVNSSQEGISRVKTSDYAYLMESSMLEYAIERDCELMQIGGLLDQKGYSIGLPKGSPYRELISTTILRLQEKTVLTELKDKWWKNKDLACEMPKKSVDAEDDATGHGIFILLVRSQREKRLQYVGLFLAFAIALLELVVRTAIEARKLAVSCGRGEGKEQRPMQEEMVKALRDSLLCWHSKEHALKRKIDALIRYEKGQPVPHYENPGARLTANPLS